MVIEMRYDASSEYLRDLAEKGEYMKKFLLFAGLMLMATPAQAFLPSYDPQQTADNIMAVKDLNKDGVIDPAEFEKVAVMKFEKIDTDSNGVISGEEMFVHRYAGRSEMNIKTPSVKQQIMNSIMKRWDHNKDKQISMDEKLEPTRNEFMRIDRDLDHQITRAELVTHWEKKLGDMKKSQEDSGSRD